MKVHGHVIGTNSSVHSCKICSFTYDVCGEVLFTISLNPLLAADDERSFFNSVVTSGELPVYLDGN